jgi:hypothetical protein
MFTRIDNILIEMRLKVGKLFDMYKTYVEKTIYFLNAHVFGHLKAKKLQLNRYCKIIYIYIYIRMLAAQAVGHILILMVKRFVTDSGITRKTRKVLPGGNLRLLNLH